MNWPILSINYSDFIVPICWSLREALWIINLKGRLQQRLVCCNIKDLFHLYLIDCPPRRWLFLIFVSAVSAIFANRGEIATGGTQMALKARYVSNCHGTETHRPDIRRICTARRVGFWMAKQ